MWIDLFGWTVMIHDDGWMLIDRRRIIRRTGTAPNSGFNRPWWRKKVLPPTQKKSNVRAAG